MKNHFNPKVSIIIPVYNGSKFLKEAIDSALNQTYKNIEILVINDGSKDKGKTEAIAKSYGNKIKYIYKENGGVSTALNLGIEKMTGEYFSWLSHDDTYYPNKIQSQIEYLKNNNLIGQKVILYSDYDLMDTYSHIFARSIKNHNELVKKPEYCLLRGAINGLSLLIPKQAFKDCGVFDEKIKCAQDYVLWEKMEEKYKFIHMPEILVTTRLHENQQGNTSPVMLAEGNSFWINLIKHVTPQKKIELEKSEYNFYYQMLQFMKTTPYTDTVRYLEEKISEIKNNINYKEIEKIKVSVIIPFYNRNNTVINSIQSVLDQTHKNIEIILIDDGSTESTESIKNFISDKPSIKYIELSKNCGVSYARNIGIDNATGEYITFLDSDDYFLKDKIRYQLTEMYLTKSLVSHTSYIRKHKNAEEQIIETGLLNGTVIPKIIAGCGIATPTLMIKTSFLKENQLYYNENLSIGEDICFYFDIFKKTDLLGILKPLTVVNTSDSSAAYSPKKQLIGLKTIISYVLNDTMLSKYDNELSLLFKEYLRIYNMNLYNQDTFCYNCYTMQNSRSWKITKPLRLISKYIRALKKHGLLYCIKKFFSKLKNKVNRGNYER